MYVFTGGICDKAIRDAMRLEQPEGVVAAVGHVEKAILILVLLVDGGHQSGCRTKVEAMFRDSTAVSYDGV